MLNLAVLTPDGYDPGLAPSPRKGEDVRGPGLFGAHARTIDPGTGRSGTARFSPPRKSAETARTGPLSGLSAGNPLGNHARALPLFAAIRLPLVGSELRCGTGSAERTDAHESVDLSIHHDASALPPRPALTSEGRTRTAPTSETRAQGNVARERRLVTPVVALRARVPDEMRPRETAGPAVLGALLRTSTARSGRFAPAREGQPSNPCLHFRRRLGLPLRHAVDGQLPTPRPSRGRA